MKEGRKEGVGSKKVRCRKEERKEGRCRNEGRKEGVGSKKGRTVTK